MENIIRAVFALDVSFHVLIVDDGSPDGTGAIVKGLQSEFSDRLFIEERSGKQGLGTAYIHGFRWALERDYKYVFEMDADFSHDPNDLPRLRQACIDGGDVAVGSRYCKGGKVENWPFLRWLMSFCASLYVRTILWIKVKDTTAGFKCYKREVLARIDLSAIEFVGYAFQIEMKYTAIRHGFKVVEVPIKFIDRQFGESKMSMSIFKEAFWGVWKMRRKKFPKT